jgi:Zn-dependent protease
MGQLTIVQEVMVWVLPVLFAVTVHEVAHGWVANLRGDSTALMMGRLTLNPLKHIDIVGTVIVPILCLVLGGFVFGNSFGLGKARSRELAKLTKT